MDIVSLYDNIPEAVLYQLDAYSIRPMEAHFWTIKAWLQGLYEYILVLPGPLLIAWVNFMDKWSHTQYSVGWKYLSIPKLQRLHRWSLGMDK